MWKLLAFASVALAQDVGEPVVFLRAQASIFSANYNTGESMEVLNPWNAVLVNGVTDDSAVQVDARRKLAGAWTPWTAGTVKRHAGGRFWARVRFRGPAEPGALQIHVTASGRSELYAVEAFDSGDREAATVSRTSVLVSTRAPVHGRDEWQARPPKEAYTPHAPVKMTLHHTASRQTTSLADSLREVRFIQDFHQNGRGWNDIAYHYLVDALGNVFEGRPENVVGAHVKNNNTGNLGVAMLGYHHAPKNEPVTAATLAAVEKLLRAFSVDYQIAPAELRGHRDFGTGTECPGDLGYAELPGLRQRLSQPPASVINPNAKITRYNP